MLKSIPLSNLIDASDIKFNFLDVFINETLSKLTFSDAIIYDITLDTIEAQIHFQSLFESFEFLDSLSLSDEYKKSIHEMVGGGSKKEETLNQKVTASRLRKRQLLCRKQKKSSGFIARLRYKCGKKHRFLRRSNRIVAMKRIKYHLKKMSRFRFKIS